MHLRVLLRKTLTGNRESMQRLRGVGSARRRRLVICPLEPVFIVGQQQCGTSWLLEALSAHRQIRGIRQIDVVRAATRVQRLPFGLRFSLAPEADRLTAFFCRSAWCPDPAVLRRLQRGQDWHRVPGAPDLPQTLYDLEPDWVRDLYRRIRAASRPEDAMDAFLEAVCTSPQDETHLVFEATDQVAVLSVLQSWQPKAKKIVIIRDARDAAISAWYSRRSIGERGESWRQRTAPYDLWGPLKGWGSRARMARRSALRGELKMIRYEDLCRDFSGILRPFLRWLGVEDSEPILASIKAMAGRPRSDEGKGSVRSAMVGEWREVLSESEQSRAWQITGHELEALGYTVGGELEALPGGLGFPS
jgi:hypothetical protein